MPDESLEAARVSSVYVHAPFCSRRCAYCDFAVEVHRSPDAREWLEALRAELAALRAEGLFGMTDVLETLYVGGGTPSVLGPEAMAGLAEVLGPGRLTSPVLEWTAEANPESLTEAVARGWRQAGVNRLSIGVQSFAPGALRWMGRLHGPEGAEDAVRRARGAGFDNISVDLIFGLPARLDRSWSDDLERALRLDVPHVSLYGLTVEPETPLGRAVAEGREEPVDADRYRDEFLLAAEVLGAAGYEHYEVSNFARPGHTSRHNSAYWEGPSYLGLGNGAHSYVHPIRRWNVRDWRTYREAAHEGRLAVAGHEEIDSEQAKLERIWLALRTRRGVALEDLGQGGREEADGWVDRGLATLSGDRLVLTAEGWLMLDRLTLKLDGLTVG